MIKTQYVFYDVHHFAYKYETELVSLAFLFNLYGAMILWVKA